MNKIGFLIALAIYALLNFYIYIRGRQALPANILSQVIYTTLFLLFSMGFIFVIALDGRAPWQILAVFENTGGYWLIIFVYALVAVLLADLLRMIDHFFHIFPDFIRTNYQQVKWIYFASVVFIILLFSVIGYFRFIQPKIVHLSMDVHVQNDTLNDLSIVAVSDVHLGNMIRKNRLEKYVSLINAQEPDIILIVGDLFDRNLQSVQAQNMDSVLRGLRSKYGTYAVLGNHEYYGNVDIAIQIMARSGITLLRDSVVNIDNRFLLIGRDDRTNRNRKSLPVLLSGVGNHIPRILLDHQPVDLTEAVENNIDLQLSGHTHEGQIFPYNLIVTRMYRLAYGYRKIGNTGFYVSSGLGLWGAPIRLGTQSEIVRITFKSN